MAGTATTAPSTSLPAGGNGQSVISAASALGTLAGYLQAINPQSNPAPATSAISRTAEDYVFMFIGMLFVLIGIVISVFSSNAGSKVVQVATKAAVV